MCPRALPTAGGAHPTGGAAPSPRPAQRLRQRRAHRHREEKPRRARPLAALAAKSGWVLSNPTLKQGKMVEASAATADAHETGQVAGKGALGRQQGSLPPFTTGQRAAPTSSPEFSQGSAPRNTGCAASKSKICRLADETSSERSLGSTISQNDPDAGSRHNGLQHVTSVPGENHAGDAGAFAWCLCSQQTGRGRCGSKTPHAAPGWPGARTPTQNAVGASTPAVVCHLKPHLHVSQDMLRATLASTTSFTGNARRAYQTQDTPHHVTGVIF